MRGKFTRSHGRRAYLRWGGQRAEVALVILHGWQLFAQVYERLGEILSEENFVVIPDLPGFGESEPISKVDFEAFAIEVRRQLTAFGITKAQVVGHSMGGAVALHLAIKYPDMVEQVFLFGSAGVPPKRSQLGWVIAGIKNWFYNLKSGGTAQPLTNGIRAVCYALRRPLWSYFSFRRTTCCNLLVNLHEVKVPITVIWGRHDLFFPSPDELCQSLGVNPTYRQNGQGHDSIFMFPEESAQLIREHLIRQE